MGYISETIRCRKLIHVREVSLGVGEQHHVTLFALKISSLYCVTFSISHGVVNYFPGAVRYGYL